MKKKTPGKSDNFKPAHKKKLKSHLALPKKNSVMTPYIKKGSTRGLFSQLISGDKFYRESWFPITTLR